MWNSEKNVEELRATHPLPAGTELTDCYIDFPVEGRLVRRDRRVLLRVGFGFWCSCQVCDQPEELSRKDDELRKEVWELSLVRLELLVTDEQEELYQMLGKAQRWLEVAIQLKFKVSRQLEACDALFKIAMLLGEFDRAVEAAEIGAGRAGIGFGENSKVVEDWERRKSNPVLYMIG